MQLYSWSGLPAVFFPYAETGWGFVFRSKWRVAVQGTAAYPADKDTLDIVDINAQWPELGGCGGCGGGGGSFIQGEANFIKPQDKGSLAVHTTPQIATDEDLENKTSDLKREKLGEQNCGQQAKHTKRYPDLLQV